MHWKNREANFGFHDYESEIVTQFEAALNSLSPDDFSRIADEVIEEYKKQTYIYTRDLMKKLKEQKYVLLAISGSHQELVKKLAAHYGFDDSIGTTYLTDESGYTGEKDFPAHDKKTALQELVKKHSLTFKDSYAVGDSKGDAAMLQLVENPLAFNPDSELYKISTEKHWPIVIERKNVIYKLSYQDNQYLIEQ